MLVREDKVNLQRSFRSISHLKLPKRFPHWRLIITTSQNHGIEGANSLKKANPIHHLSSRPLHDFQPELGRLELDLPIKVLDENMEQNVADGCEAADRDAGRPDSEGVDYLAPDNGLLIAEQSFLDLLTQYDFLISQNIRTVYFFHRCNANRFFLNNRPNNMQTCKLPASFAKLISYLYILEFRKLVDITL